MYAANHDVFRVLNAMAKLDPDGVGPALARSERRRAAGMSGLAGRLAEQGLLRPNLTPDRAAQIIWILASFDAYDILTTGWGLRPETAAKTLVDIAEHALR